MIMLFLLALLGVVFISLFFSKSSLTGFNPTPTANSPATNSVPTSTTSRHPVKPTPNGPVFYGPPPGAPHVNGPSAPPPNY